MGTAISVNTFSAVTCLLFLSASKTSGRFVVQLISKENLRQFSVGSKF